MSIESSLIAHLRADAGLIALVGSRVRLKYAEPSDTSRVIVHRISGDHYHHMAAATGIVRGRFQLNCDADTPIKSIAISEAIRQSLDGFRGTMGDVFVQMCHLESESDDETAPIPGASTGIYSQRLDYLIAWGVSVPVFT